jgi:L-fuconolactonase
MQPIIDTHIHIWNFEKANYAWLEKDTSILKRNYEIEELFLEKKHVGITGGILVQAANNLEDTDWMLEVADREVWIQGVVGWLPLTDPKATEKLLVKKYKNHLLFKGVRHLIHDEPDPRWLLQKNVLESLSLLAAHNISYDVVGIHDEHIETALQVAYKIPNLRMIFDHMNQPPMEGYFGRWGQLMRVAATHPNFYMKISGLGTASKKINNWTAEDIKPCIAFALELFGEDRCCVGGDWPVSLLAGSYTYTWQTYRAVLEEMLNEQGLQQVYSLNASAFYKLND